MEKGDKLTQTKIKRIKQKEMEELGKERSGSNGRKRKKGGGKRKVVKRENKMVEKEGN